MSNATLDLKYVQQEITQLLVSYPELEEDEVLRADSVEGQTSAFEFLSMVVRKIYATQAIAIGTVAFIKEMQERKARLERQDEGLRRLIMKVMNTAELKNARLPEATLSIRAGTPHVIIVNEQEIPNDFMRIKKEPDKLAIKAALTNGGHVLGTVLSNSEPTLQIRK